MRLLPALDIKKGECVSVPQGRMSDAAVVSRDPVAQALAFKSQGFDYLHIVDLDGAKSGIPANLHALERVAKATELRIDYGGGIKTDEDLKRVFDARAEFVNIGSVAVKDPELFFEWIAVYGSDSILLGADVRERMVAIHGWQTDTDFEIIAFLRKYYSRGVEQAFVTDIGKDGALQGPAVELYGEIIREVPDLKLIASGGVSSLDDIDQLEKIGCSAVIVGKAIYEGRVTLGELAKRSCSQNA